MFNYCLDNAIRSRRGQVSWLRQTKYKQTFAGLLAVQTTHASVASMCTRIHSEGRFQEGSQFIAL